MIKLSEEATEQHDLRTEWPTLLFVALVVGLVFGIKILTDHLPGLRYTGALLLLNAYWAFTVYVVARFGWRAYRWPQLLNLIGSSLYLGGFILPHSFIAGSFAQFVAGLAIFGGIAPRFFTVSRKAPVAVGENR